MPEGTSGAVLETDPRLVADLRVLPDAAASMWRGTHPVVTCMARDPVIVRLRGTNATCLDRFRAGQRGTPPARRRW